MSYLSRWFLNLLSDMTLHIGDACVAYMYTPVYSRQMYGLSANGEAELPFLITDPPPVLPSVSGPTFCEISLSFALCTIEAIPSMA